MACESAGRNTRTAESVGPPGGNGIRRRTGLLGYGVCACPDSASPIAAHNTIAATSLFIPALPCFCAESSTSGSKRCANLSQGRENFYK